MLKGCAGYKASSMKKREVDSKLIQFRALMQSHPSAVFRFSQLEEYRYREMSTSKRDLFGNRETADRKSLRALNRPVIADKKESYSITFVNKNYLQ